MSVLPAFNARMGYEVVDTDLGPVELLPGEILDRVEPAAVVSPPALPDAVGELMRLAEVTSPDRIGFRGPLIAGLPLSEGSDAEHFRLFEALFGRDALVTTSFLRERYPQLARTTLLELARWQGLPRSQAPNPALYDNRDEEAGRIPHEVRDPRLDPVAQRLTQLEAMDWPMYRTDDATLLFAREVLTEAARTPRFLQERVTQRDGVTRTLGDSLAAALQWAQSRTDELGMIESTRPPIRYAQRPDTPPNTYPIWQDSWDSAFRPDGTIAMGPMCFIEVQAYLHDMLTGSAALAERDRAWARAHNVDAAALRRQAVRLEATVVGTFFQHDPRGDYFAYAAERTAGGLRALPILKSSSGHLLDSGILSAPRWRGHVDAVVRSLLDPAQGLVSASGIRTLSSREARFRPGAYHSGAVWGFDNHIIARGLRRHGYADSARWVDRTFRGTIETIRHYAEFVRGDDSPVPRENRLLVHAINVDPHIGRGRNLTAQPAQPTQAWTVAAYIDAGDALLRPAVSGARARSTEQLLLPRLNALQRGGPLAASATLGLS
jgi:glycogen debranching enzyme